jgi:flagellar hook protein FlgE
MNRALFSGVSGLRAFQTWLDVISNNVANVNTPGFKSSRAEFGDVLSQLIRTGTSPDNGGASEPVQLGLGVRVAAMTTNFGQGSLQTTGRLGDVAIQGEGFFVLAQNGTQMYSRAGVFRFDANGNLSDPTGALVQGWMADPVTGVITDGAATTNLTVDPNSMIPSEPTTEVTMGGRLPAGALVGDTVTTQGTVYDTLGTLHQIEFRFTKTAANQWNQEIWQGATQLLPAAQVLDFDATTGELLNPLPAALPVYAFTPPGGAAPMTFTVGYGTVGVGNPLSQFDGTMTAAVTDRDGSVAGELRALAIGDTGDLMATFSNGEVRTVGRIATATFGNPGGLEKLGDNHWRATPGAGIPQIGSPGSAARGALAPGTVEGSNVDLSQEFSNLIIAQRGFQANTKIISTSDEMLADLIQIKR